MLSSQVKFSADRQTDRQTDTIKTLKIKFKNYYDDKEFYKILGMYRIR